MSLTKADHIITSLAEVDDFFRDTEVLCWKKEQSLLSIYLFTQVFADEKALLEGFKLLRDHIAVSFQSQTGITGAERWNLYLFYFVKDQVSQPVKQLIEEDKFSTRKIVCSGFSVEIDDEIITKEINDQLFEFHFMMKTPAGSSLEKKMSEEFPAVYKSLMTLGAADTYEAIDPLLNLLNND